MEHPSAAAAPAPASTALIPAPPRAVLAALVFLIFSILGTQLFAGLLWSCNDASVAGKVNGELGVR